MPPVSLESGPNVDPRKRVEEPKNIEYPQDHCDDNDAIQN